MFDQISILQQIGLSVLAVASAVWVVGLVRMLRRDRFGVTARREGRVLRGLPRQPSHPGETVQLTAAERDAFTGLVRQFTEGRP